MPLCCRLDLEREGLAPDSARAARPGRVAGPWCATKSGLPCSDRKPTKATTTAPVYSLASLQFFFHSIIGPCQASIRTFYNFRHHFFLFFMIYSILINVLSTR